MSFTIYKTRDINELDLFVNGGILGADTSKGFRGLIGTTLTFDTPPFAVTFTEPVVTDRDPNVMLFTDIKTQIEAADPNILVKQIGGRIALVEKVPTDGVQLDVAATNAKTILGFSGSKVSGGRVLRQMFAPNPPRIETIYQTNDGTHVVVVWEGN